MRSGRAILEVLSSVLESPAPEQILFSPVAVLTRSHHRPIDPIAYDCVKLIVVRAGSARLFSELGTRHVKVGDVVLLPAHALCGAEPEEWITTTTIYLDRDYLVDQVFWQYAARFSHRHDASHFLDIHYAEPIRIVRIGEDRAGLLTPWLDELASLSIEGLSPHRFLRGQALLFSILDVVVPFIPVPEQRASEARHRTIPSAPRHREFKPLRVEAQQAARLIRDDPARRWSVRELSLAVHLSSSQFRRVFVEAFGKAPIAYLTMVRIEQMAYLLRSTDLPIARIAALSGWKDADFATRQFRTSLGISPRAYRQETRPSVSHQLGSAPEMVVSSRH